MALEALEFRGHSAVSLALPSGDSILVALHGGHLLSWRTGDGIERLYLSPRAVFDGQAAIRGGVPVCCPQFNMRGALPKHGFMRNRPWQVEDSSADGLVLGLRADAGTRAIWPADFHARLRIGLAPRRLRIALELQNTGGAPWSFAAALHTYLRVDDIANARLEGLQGANRWDAVRDSRHVETAAALRFEGEFDSVYASAAGPLRLVQPAGVLEIAQSASCTETVVWNPGEVLCAGLADMPADGWRHMLCVEAARIDQPVLLGPTERWSGWQQLTAH